MCLPSTLWIEPPFLQLSEGESLLEQKEMILMNINAYHTPLNKLTDQAIKLRLLSYLLIITGFSLLQHKKGMLYTYASIYCICEISKFTQMNHQIQYVFSPSLGPGVMCLLSMHYNTK